MTAGRDDAAYLWDMYEAAGDVREFVAGRTWEDYLADKMLRAAVERKVEIIGEAARGVSKAFQDAHPSVPWRPITSQRHRLAHEYATILNARIWQVATVHVPDLIALLAPLLPPKPPDPEPEASTGAAPPAPPPPTPPDEG